MQQSKLINKRLSFKSSLFVSIWLVAILSVFAHSAKQLAYAASIAKQTINLADKQVLRRANGSEPQSLDPHKSEGVPSANIQRDLYEGLISENAQGDLVPAVAERWQQSKDGKTYTFYLRKSARWSNGEPVTAHDFVYSWQRIVTPATGSYYSQTLAPILNAEDIIQGIKQPSALAVRAIDDFTLEVRLKGPTPYFLGLLTHSSMYPVHKASLEKYGDKFSQPDKLVGNGAYKLEEWQVHSHILLSRNKFYWDDNNTRIEQVYFYPIENQNSELNRYRAGEIDITEGLPITQLKWVRENLNNELHIIPYLGTYYYGFNLTKSPFKENPYLRQALSMVIDREIITDKILKTGDIPAYSWVPPNVMNYESIYYEWKDWPIEKRIKEAKILFSKAGYGPDNPLEIEIRYNTNENHKKIAIVIASMWKRHLGVKTTLYNEEWKVFLANRKGKKVTQVFRAGWIADYNDAYSFAELLHSQHGINDGGYNNSEYDRNLELSATEANVERRKQYLQNAEQLMLKDYAIIPIYHYTSKHMVKPYVGGYVDNTMDHHYSKHLYILKH